MPDFKFDASAYAAGTRQAPHQHEDLQITIVLRGRLEERVGRNLERPGTFSVVTKDPGVLHEDTFAPEGSLTARLSISATFADFVEHPVRAEAWRWRHDPRMARPFLRIVTRGLEGIQRFAADDDDVIDLVAALSARDAATIADAPDWLQRTVQRLYDDWRPTTVGDVAKALDLHPVYFARCVRRWYGIGAAELLRDARLRLAARAIATSDQTVAVPAFQTGYADEPHLSRDLATATGMPPAR